MMRRIVLGAAVAALSVALAACNTQTVRSTAVAPIAVETAQLAESELLDVGIGLFDPGIDALDEEEAITTPTVREAEARYMPQVLMETLQGTGAWGAVRVIPNRQSESDLWVDGRILASDGEQLRLAITATDSTGRVWHRKNYEAHASRYAYDPTVRGTAEPFQGLYNEIANDLLEARRRLAADDVAAIRAVTRLRFARRFAPQVYAEHLEDDGRGAYRIRRLPAEGDPVLARIDRIRARDDLFVDTLQDGYSAYARRVAEPYRRWRAEAYEEVQALQDVRSDVLQQALVSGLAIVGGVLAQGSGNAVARTAGMVGIGAGAMLGMNAWERNKDKQIHTAALEEMAQSLGSEVAPATIELDDRTVTLTGSVEEQYRQWRALLHEMYVTETGIAPGAGKP